MGNDYGEIRIFAGNYAPKDWLFCQGQLLLITSYPDLYARLGTTYGGDGITNFALPDLQGRLPVSRGDDEGVSYNLGQKGGVESVALTEAQIPNHSHPLRATSNLSSDSALAKGVPAQTRAIHLYQTQGAAVNLAANAVSSVGNSQPHTNLQPYLCVNFIVGLTYDMSYISPFIGEIRMLAFDLTPPGWLPCNGQVLSIVQHPTLFSLLGTTYGGDGVSTFALPDLRGRAPMHPGQGPGLTARALGESGGVQSVALTANEIPAHTHTLKGNSSPGNTPAPKGHTLARAAGAYQTATSANLTSLGSVALTSYGSGASHTNMMHYITFHFCIAEEGRFPPYP